MILSRLNHYDHRLCWLEGALQQALEYHNSGNMGAARLAYEEALVIDPDNSAAVEGLNHIRQMEAMGIQGVAPTAVPTPAATTALTGTLTSPSAGNTAPVDKIMRKSFRSNFFPISAFSFAQLKITGAAVP